MKPALYRIASALLAGWMIFFIACPAAAEDEIPPDICQKYAAELSDREIADLEEELQKFSPVRQAALARRIEIANIPLTDENWMPSVRPDDRKGHYVIVIPSHFRRLVCSLMVRQIDYMTRATLEIDALSKQTDECLLRGEKPSVCIYATSIGASILFQESPGLDAESQTLVDKWTNDAIFFVLAHEFAHVFNGDVERPTADMETRADAFAMGLVMNAAKETYVPFSLFSSLVMADDFLSGSRLHQSNICRAASVNAIMTQLNNKIASIYHWSPTEIGKYRDHREEAKDRQVGNLLSVSQMGRMKQARCERAGDKARAKIVKDLDAIIASLDQISKPMLTGPVEATSWAAAIGNIRVETTEARYIVAKVLSYSIRGTHRAERNKPQADVDFLALSNAALNGVYKADMAALDYGRLLTVNVIGKWESFPEGTPLQPTIDTMRSELKTALYYDPDFGLTYLYLVVAELTAGRCTEAERWLSEVKSRMDDVALFEKAIDPIFAEIESVGCLEATKGYRRGFATEG